MVYILQREERVGQGEVVWKKFIDSCDSVSAGGL